jgi:DNA-directed RNA polymerase subunit RPC12/RpoP
MNVTYRCVDCSHVSRSPIPEEGGAIVCQQCGSQIRFPPEAVQEGGVRRCVVCPSTELFVRKDFSQRLGVTIIVVGFIASSVAWAYHQSVLSLAILIGTALIDAALYLVTGNVLTCYRCHSEYRDVTEWGTHPGFELEVHERYRQQEARLAEADRGVSREGSSHAPPPSRSSASGGA